MYGDDTDMWIGKAITMYATEVEFGGKMVMGIRVRMQPPQTNPQQGFSGPPAGPTPSQSGYDQGPDNPNNYPEPTNVQRDDNLSDEIPF